VTPSETIVAMTISAMLLAGMLSTVFFAWKLVATAPSDTNPHTFGAVAAAVARLEGSAAAKQRCLNPDGETSRTDCLTVVNDPVEPQTHDGHTDCWVMNTASDPRLECWERLDHGDLVAHRYAPASTITDPADVLYITDWADDAIETLPRASGLVSLSWEPATATEPVRLTTCAAIRPDQRQLMAEDEVPFCDGEVGLRPGGSERTDANGNPCSTLSAPLPSECVEGYPMPPLRVFS